MFKIAKNIVAGKSRSVAAQHSGARTGLMIAATVGIFAAVAASDLHAQTADAVLQKSDRETLTIPEDRLAVTLGTPQGADEDSSYAIWVGEVERDGRKTVWVELIDDHGEVIYDSEVSQNETHLLPDGRAVVVRAMTEPQQAETRVAKTDQSRVAPDARLVVTRRVVDDPNLQTTIEFIEETSRPEPSAMMRIAAFGNAVWSAIVASIGSAADSVVVAWNWITEPFRA
ncbi:hypothetical protein [Stappia indica]|uniref:hypothetical protein n=1 Tax=Stappia indica TaxID=538381 RepID=UPI000AE3A3BC|nr:hypothetical protein [Stappia indica]